jgi:pimeloyl-ACP methyl ester carboxylesterase
MAAAATMALGVLAGTAPAVAATSSPAQVKAPVPVLDWQPCGVGLEAFLCASAEVPEDYDEPAGSTTTIALTKLPATDPARRIGTLFTNPGGPGGPGVDFVWAAGQTAYTPEVLARYDVLGFDPRGVGASDPATCFRTVEEENAAFADVPAFPVTDREERRYIGTMARVGRKCALISGDRISHASTANVARDMDLLRQAVGDDRLHYVGYSYGTFLGATYAKLFPGRVGRFVLDGTLEPRRYVGTTGAPSSLGARTGQGLAASETFAEFLRLCAEAGPDACALAALGDPATVVEQTFERLRTDPVSLPVGDGQVVEVTYDRLVAELFSAMYQPEGWSEVAAIIAFVALESAATTAPLSAGAAAAVARVERGETDFPDRPRRGAQDYSGLGAALASLCVDTEHPLEPSQYAALADEQDAAAPHFGRFRAWVGVQCEFLPVDDEDAYTGPWKQTTRAPVLVIGTRFDPATPYEATRPYAALWPNARVLTVEGYGHTILGKSACADEAVARYLVDGTRDVATCDQDLAPFSPEPLRTAATRPQVTTQVPALP